MNRIDKSRFKENNDLMQKKIEVYYKESNEERKKRKKQVCEKCYYSCNYAGANNGVICYYICITGKMRPCASSDCIKSGIYMKKEPRKAFKY